MSNVTTSLERTCDHPPTGDARTRRLARQTLTYARERQYRGWDYGDGMSSRVLAGLPIETKWLNIAVQELVKRPPVNLRPLFLVEQRRNYKGASLFALSTRTLYLLSAPSESDWLDESHALVEWLVENRCTGYSGFCGGHRHPIQHLDGRVGRPEDPDAVSTSYAVRALLSNASLDDSYAELARTAADFVMDDLNFRPTNDGAIVNYHLNHDPSIYTINAGALVARLFLDLYDYFERTEYRLRATALLDHIATLQAMNGGWYYRDPPASSHLSMDSHHNGFIIEAFQRYAELVDDDRYGETYRRAMRFYRSLFSEDGAPAFDESSSYPRDIHASAQGILVFTYAGEYAKVADLIHWVREHLYAGGGRFYFRKHRWYTQRFTLMRWCQAWMAYALTEYLRFTIGRGQRQVFYTGLDRL